MDVFKRKDERKIYTVINYSKNAYAVVRVLNMYETKDEAIEDCLKVVNEEITDEELIQQLTKSDKF